MRRAAKRSVKRTKRVLRRAWRSADPVLDLFDSGRSRCYPKDYDELDGYKSRFPDSARVFEVFVKRCGPIADGRDGPVAVAVMSWFGTPCPWYAIAIGVGLAQRGRSVVFVWHDTTFPELSRYPDPQNDEIRRVLHKLEARFPVLRLSEQPEAGDLPGDDALVDGLADANLMWNVRGAAPNEDQVRFRDRMRKHMANALPRVRSVMRDNGFQYAVVPGGVVGPSGLYLDAGRAAGVRVATFDAGLGWSEVNTDGVAAQQTDMPRAFELLTGELGGREEAAIEAARAEFDKRRSGLDLTQYQLERSSSGPAAPPNNILIPLSVIFDASALGRHHVFADSTEWLTETISALLEHTSDPILVRQHPSERRKTERSRFDARAILSETFGSNPQVQFIAAEDPQSTYDLLDASRLVLPFVSTIGIEAAALGKPVIISGAVYYAGLGFVRAPSSRDAYFDALRQGARGELPMLPGQVEKAWLCYYLNAVCHRVFTNFTPQPPDFWRWVARQPNELYNDPGVNDILTSIDENVPLPILRHRRLERVATNPDAASSELADRR